jgi:hypothetical protein
LFLYRIWPQPSGVERHGFLVWLSTWIGFNIVVFFALLRSAAMCTV